MGIHAWMGRAAGALAVSLLVGCSDAPPPTAPSPGALFSCLVGPARSLEVGEVLQLEGEQGRVLCLSGEEGAEYLYVPFFASPTGTAQLTLELNGGGFGQGLRSARAKGAALAPADSAVPDEHFHHQLRRREIRELTPLIPAARSGSAASGARLAAPPAVGDLLTLNTSTDCDALERQIGRVEAVSRTAIVVADTSNPPGGFTEEDWQFFGAAFDTLVNPVDVRNFGEPTDIDENDRVIIFFTRAVNDLTEPGSGSFVGGFFWAGDLFPNRACQGSNTAEIFYLLVPDPQRAQQGERVFEPSYVKRVVVGTLAHEYQHLINAGRRIYLNDATGLEDVWLNEGLSHIAEELVFYEATGLEPRMNLDAATVLATPHRQLSFAAYAASNFSRLLTYLEDPTRETLLGVDELPTRGASWAFLRYVADHEDGPDAPLFFALVNGRESGIANLANALEADPLDLIQAWTVSVYTDDAVPAVPFTYQQPSWNFRSIMGLFTDGDAEYPLEVIVPRSGVQRTLTLQGGGAAYVRFQVPAQGRAVLQTTVSGAAAPPELRLSIVRIR